MDLETFQRLLLALLSEFERRYYFQEALGYECVDMDHPVYGYMGKDPQAYAILRLRKPGLWPVDTRGSYSDDDLFDIVEFVYDNVSKPVSGRHHAYQDCGWHYVKFDKSEGKREFRESVNALLRDFGEGWTLSESGEILRLGSDDYAALLDIPLPRGDDKNVLSRVNLAVRKYRTRASTPDDQRDAVRDLADVLEFLRGEAKRVLTKRDESDLFELANSFGVRHHREDQKTDYDPKIWIPWMFYYYLCTIHALLSILEREGVPPPKMPETQNPPTRDAPSGS